MNYSLKAGKHASWRNITAKVILSNITQVRKAATGGDANIVFNRSVLRCINSQVLKRKSIWSELRLCFWFVYLVLNGKFWMHASALSLFVCYFKITFARNTPMFIHVHPLQPADLQSKQHQVSDATARWQVRPESRGAHRLYGLYVWKSWHTLLPVGLKYHASQSWTYKESRSRTMLVYRNIEKGPVWNRVAQRCVPNVV